MTRISTSMVYDQSVAAMTRQSSDLFKTQQQLSSGRRMLTPADDPLASSHSLQLTQSIAVNSQFKRNQGYAKDSLNLLDGTLQSVTDIVTYVRERAVAAGDAVLSPQDLKAIAVDVRAQFEALRGIANTRDATGDYVLSGYKSQVEPFVGDADTGVTYAGDQGTRTMQVSASRHLPVSVPGSEIFGDVFDTLSSFIKGLEDPGSHGGIMAVAGAAIDNLDVGLQQAVNVRTKVGSQLVELDQLDSINSDLDLQLQKIRSGYQDLDYAEAVTRMSREQTFLQAAQQTFTKVSNLSLFNYLD